MQKLERRLPQPGVERWVEKNEIETRHRRLLQPTQGIVLMDVTDLAGGKKRCLLTQLAR